MQIPDRFWIPKPPISPFIARDNRREIVLSNENTPGKWIFLADIETKSRKHFGIFLAISYGSQ
jgi:hypothetical protein